MIAKKMIKITMAVLSILVGLYPIIYFVIDRNFGLLQSKSVDVLSSGLWNLSFYMHIVFGGIALMIGWRQFGAKFRLSNPRTHRVIGKIYVIAALFSALAGLYMAFYATGGIITAIGFGTLGAVWFYTTFMAFNKVRNGRIFEHQKLMIYSYAACFSAVTLRIYLPLLISVFQDFNTAYLIVAWLCWVPNMFVAYLLICRLKRPPELTAQKDLSVETQQAISCN